MMSSGGKRNRNEKCVQPLNLNERIKSNKNTLLFNIGNTLANNTLFIILVQNFSRTRINT